ncbi:MULTISPECIES: NAD(P)/FAD-dependent oxidoreductase [Priestia]|jgi:uncharacterized FAD-dependent dehydrogenase|uniref:NAD(P)/FAD-dependent oxidoreductase n=1 Tax=Priestia TaxID=2800373 RepID=UPI000BEE4DBE|nr:NAD(FAD)-utilizing dehydrogenase [Priestia megaterium]MED3855057.1 NAD(FAD)-utilizing dehydrogenase [Priestia megaterium]MED4170660.1 NAD(FAD)-utilizing dehydrogenase [Priestia megaterium]PEB60675.1 NAD(FAD)-utilizing dehydrogenase [Priestia megaterium]
MYDITIVGSGVSSIFLAYTLLQSDQKILILEKGKPLEQRDCALDHGEPCHCDLCEKYFGFAGLGKSEGKFNYTSNFGGELAQKIGKEHAMQAMREVDDILCLFGGEEIAKYSTVDAHLAKKAQSFGLQMLTTEVRHLGTSLSTQIFQRMYDMLSRKIEIQFEVDITEIKKEAHSFIITTNQGIIHSHKVVIATGRSGTEWLQRQCSMLGVKQGTTRLDLGVRVEMKEQQLRSILQDTFETKLSYIHEDLVSTTYCMNPRGRIIRKHQEGFVMPDGQNFREKEHGTSNLNFTLFTSRYFPTLAEANAHAQKVIGSINDNRERIIVQRLGDLRTGRPTTVEQMAVNRICPTLQAECGDLTAHVPSIYIHILKRFLQCLEAFIGETIDEDTLLYGMDGKFYSPIIETTTRFETSVSGLYLIGDCSGITHSLSQAAASGIYVGHYLSDSVVTSKQNEH